MKKPDIARRIARQSRVSRAEAADRLDRVVNQLLADVRKGKRTSLPGLGYISNDKEGRALFVPEGSGNVTA
jgi:nucleoid DNA-binding protein